MQEAQAGGSQAHAASHYTGQAKAHVLGLDRSQVRQKTEGTVAVLIHVPFSWP